MTLAVVGLGTNLGARRALLMGAMHALSARPGLRVLGRSRLYETPPLGPPQPDYLNAALLLEWSRSANALLSELHCVERLLGRERRERWGPRTIDLDLLWWGEGEVDEPGLRIPHPGLLLRNFALAPLLDVLPDPPELLVGGLVELGGAPLELSWPELAPCGAELQGGAGLRVASAVDDSEVISLMIGAALWGRGTGAVARDAMPFEFPIGDVELSIRLGVETARRAGFSASWACVTEYAPTGPTKGVYLGEYRAAARPLYVDNVRIERGAELLIGGIHVRERA